MDNRRPGKERALIQVKPLEISSFLFVVSFSWSRQLFWTYVSLLSVDSLDSLISIDLPV